MSKHEEDFKDPSGLGWVIIVIAALLFASMPLSIGLFKYFF